MTVNTKTTTDGLLALDIRELTKLGAIKTGHNGTLTWSMNDNLLGRIQYAITSDNTIDLQYFKHIDGNKHSTTQSILLDTTPCHLGGHRQWLLCPDCAKRVAIVYFTDTHFSCRHCHQLSYQSQNETAVKRQRRKARKLRVKMGASSNLFEPVWDKPKGMHYKTFERLKKTEFKLNYAVLQSMIGDTKTNFL